MALTEKDLIEARDERHTDYVNEARREAEEKAAHITHESDEFKRGFHGHKGGIRRTFGQSNDYVRGMYHAAIEVIAQ